MKFGNETISEEDLEVRVYRGQSKPDHQGPHSSPPNPCVRVTHKPSGIYSECSKYRNTRRNKREAMANLDLLLGALAAAYESL